MTPDPKPPATDSGRVLRSSALLQQLEEEIVVGKIPAGTRLGTKADLRARFQVAPATINEAVRMLEMRGLVDARPGPGGGLFVRASGPLIRLQHVTLKVKNATAAAVRDALAVRGALEGPLCLDAGQFHTKRHLRKFEVCLDDLQNAADPQEYMRAVWRLHREISSVTPNQILREVYLGLLDLVEQNLEDVHPDEEVRTRRNRDHRLLVEAITSREAKRITRAVARHNAQSIING
jgi:DNA-binding FadR family transcriptional regulator